MNKDTAKDYLPLVQALAEGKLLQHRGVVGWYDVTNVYFDSPATDYRIKPEPREIWYNRYNTGVESGPYESKEKALEYAFPHHTTVPVCYREVLE